MTAVSARPSAAAEPVDGLAQRGIDPLLAEPPRVRRQPLPEREPVVGGQPGQVVEVRPGPLRVHVVRGHRADAAPVVDAGADEHAELVGIGEVRRRLQMRRGAEHEPSGGDGGEVPVGGEVGLALHRRPCLRAEVLDDRLLHVTPPLVRCADRDERLRPVLQRLADAEQHAGRERHPAASGVLEHLEAQGRVLVGGAVMDAAALGPEPDRCRLEHHAHGRRERAQPLELDPGEHAGVEVRQQTGLLEHQPSHRAEVVERRRVAARRRASRLRRTSAPPAGRRA